MTPERQAEHDARLQRISDKCLAATGNRPDVLAAGWDNAVALEGVLDRLLAEQSAEGAVRDD